MKLINPTPTPAWAELVVNPTYNGGDVYPDGMQEAIGQMLTQMPAFGLEVDGTPSVLVMLQPTLNPREYLLHWCSDGRCPFADSLDAIDAVLAQYPRSKFIAFVRRPALVRLLKSRAWVLTASEDAPYMAMLCRATG